MTTEVIDERYYINVASKMVEKGLAFQRPRLRRKVIYDKVDGFVPIVSINTGVMQ